MGSASGAIARHRPMASKIRRLPRDSAMTRSSSLGDCSASVGTASITATLSLAPARAQARLPPTRPPPIIVTSYSCIVIASVTSAVPNLAGRDRQSPEEPLGAPACSRHLGSPTCSRTNRPGFPRRRLASPRPTTCRRPQGRRQAGAPRSRLSPRMRRSSQGRRPGEGALRRS